jgi:threonine/homoserine/homoserine lactone efflux protein
VLGAVHMLDCGIVYPGVGMTARTVLRARPVIGRAITRFSGAVMIVIGVLLLAEALAGVTWRPR